VNRTPIDYTDIVKSLGETTNPDEIFSAVHELRQMTRHIPAMLRKAEDPTAGIHNDPAKRGPKSVFFDPLTLQYSLGYKDRRYNLTYDTLRRVAHQVSIIGAIINTRIAQVAAFSEPYRTTKSLGYQIKHKSPDHHTDDAERDFIQRAEAFIACCGEPGQSNPWTRMRRPKFEAFLKCIVRDTLTFDQLTFEVVPRRNGIPFEFWATDASTMRLASPDRDAGMHFSYHQRNSMIPTQRPHRFTNLYEGQTYGEQDVVGQSVRYVQVVNGQIENVYFEDEMAFGIRNPRSDIYIQGYGYGELEQLITIITGVLYAEEYNRRFFSQGANPKGILNFKGDNWTLEQLEAFRRQWAAQVAGAENAWKTPVTQSEGLEWVDLQRSNQEMGFQGWLEYLIKITCGVYLIDPAEINFDLHGGVQQTPLFESSQEWKLKASRDRGLKPLLKFIAGLINEYIIDKIDDHFVFEFAGLDELTEQEKHELLTEQIGSYLTLNEARRQLDLPDIPGGIGEIPLNPTLVQLLQIQQQREDTLRDRQEQQAQQEQGMQQDQQQEPPDPEKEQKVRHNEDKHPLEMELLQQKVAQGGAQLAGAGMQPGEPEMTPPADESAEPDLSATSDEQAPEAAAPAGPNHPDTKKQYAGLFGKSVTFDNFIDFMRSQRESR